jgi:hypothetical protein
LKFDVDSAAIKETSRRPIASQFIALFAFLVFEHFFVMQATSRFSQAHHSYNYVNYKQ